MFTQDRRLVALTCHVKLSSEPVLLSICRNSKKPFSICQVVLVCFCRYLITYSILSLTLSRCLSEWDNKANWIDSREMWNFNTNRAGPVTRHWSRARDQRDKLNIYICRAPVSTLCTLQIEQTIQFHRLPASCSLTTGLTPEEQIRAGGQAVVRGPGAAHGVHCWQHGNNALVLMNRFVCPESYDYPSPGRIKSGP